MKLATSAAQDQADGSSAGRPARSTTATAHWLVPRMEFESPALRQNPCSTGPRAGSGCNDHAPAGDTRVAPLVSRSQQSAFSSGLDILRSGYQPVRGDSPRTTRPPRRVVLFLGARVSTTAKSARPRWSRRGPTYDPWGTRETLAPAGVSALWGEAPRRLGWGGSLRAMTPAMTSKLGSVRVAFDFGLVFRNNGGTVFADGYA